MPDTMERYQQWIDKVVDQLNKLIQLDFDAALTYKDALAHVDDPAVRFDLETFLVDHERHIMQLTSIVRDLGGTPIEVQRDLKGAVLEGVTRLRSRSGTLGALRAMRTNERLANRIYDKAAAMNMPPIGVAVMLEHLEDERHHLVGIEAHIARLTGQHYYEVDRIDREASEIRPTVP